MIKKKKKEIILYLYTFFTCWKTLYNSLIFNLFLTFNLLECYTKNKI